MQLTATRHIVLIATCLLLGCLGACVPPAHFYGGQKSPQAAPSGMGATTAEASARLYRQSREKFSAGDYAGSLALIRTIRSRSNPPQLDRAEAMVLEAMWNDAVEQYRAKKYGDALETIATLETRANPPELALAKGIVRFYAGDLDQAARCFLDPALAADPRALAPLGFVYFEKGYRDLADSAWANALAADPDSRLAMLGSSMIAYVQGDPAWREGFGHIRGDIAALPPWLGQSGRAGSTMAAMQTRMPAPLPIVPVGGFDPKPPGPGLQVYAAYRNKIFMTGETITTDTVNITIDSFRLELGEDSPGPPQSVTFALFGPSDPPGKVTKGTREISSAAPAGDRIYEKLKIAGLKLGDNRLVITVINSLGATRRAHLTIKRIDVGYQKLAILMGVREYLWDPHWEAGFVEKDLAGLKEVLVRQGYRVRTMTDPTIDQLVRLIRRLRSPNAVFSDDDGQQIALGDNDDVIVYYSGHGFRVNPGMPNEFGYLVPYRAAYNPSLGQPDDEGCLPMDDLVNSLKFSRARHKLLILDTCYAALAGTAKSPPQPPRSCDRMFIEQRGLFLMAASERDEKSWMYRHMRQSAFTRLLVDALKGRADSGDSGCITLYDIAGYIQGRLENQNPVFRFLSNGNGMPYFENFAK